MSDQKRFVVTLADENRIVVVARTASEAFDGARRHSGRQPLSTVAGKGSVHFFGWCGACSLAVSSEDSYGIADGVVYHAEKCMPRSMPPQQPAAVPAVTDLQPVTPSCEIVVYENAVYLTRPSGAHATLGEAYYKDFTRREHAWEYLESVANDWSAALGGLPVKVMPR